MIGALLRMPWEVVRVRMLERLREQGFTDLDPPHLNVIGQYPGPDGARPSELAARLRVSKQALNYLVGQLEQRGYLERQPDQEDMRSRRIALTPRGHAAFRLIREAVRELEQDWEERLGVDEFAQLRQLLQRLNQLA
jgi:DNA-binding MarR family transcriptional regulator